MKDETCKLQLQDDRSLLGSRPSFLANHTQMGIGGLSSPCRS